MSKPEGPNTPSKLLCVSESKHVGSKGHALAWLEIEKSVLAWGDELAGSLVIEGGPRGCVILDPFHVSLEYPLSDVHYSMTRRQILPGAHLVAPRVTQRIPLRLVIPNTVPFQHPVLLKVAPLSLPRAAAAKFLHDQPTAGWSRGPTMALKVVPPDSCIVIASQFCEMAKMALRTWERSQEGSVIGRFNPLEGQSVVCGAAIRLFSQGPAWCGYLQLFRRIRWRVEEVRLNLPFLASDPEEIREQLLEVLREASFRMGDRRTLPIPTNPAPATARELPLPAALRLSSPHGPESGGRELMESGQMD